MLDSLRIIYARCWRYALSCPLLFCLPIAAEAMQHIAEYSQGFYADLVNVKANEYSLLRVGFATIKILSVMIARYWVMRWLEWGDRERTTGGDRQSIATFMPWLMFEGTITLPTIWLPVFMPSLATPLLILSLISFALGLLFSDWSRTAAIGESGGPVPSARKVAPIFLWAAGFTLAAILPPMAVHYGLLISAMKAVGGCQLVVLATDTIFVGYLSAIVCGAPWCVSQHARALGGFRQAKGGNPFC